MLKVLYAGSPEAAAETLNILFQNSKNSDFKIVGVLTNPPSMQGRHKDLIPTPVETCARENGISVFTPEHLDSSAREEIAPLKADVLVCFAYGHIFGPKFLELFPMGGINLHPSLLPKYRGCTPVPAAILNRDEKTAATIQTLSLKMDEGDVLAQEIITLNQTETADTLLMNSAKIGAKLITEILKTAATNGKFPLGTAQTGETSYTGILTKTDGKIDWNKSALQIDAQIRAFTPNPGTWTLDGSETLKIIRAIARDDDEESEGKPVGSVIRFSKADGIFIKCGQGQLCVTELQKQGKKAMNHKDFMNGSRDFIGKIL